MFIQDNVKNGIGGDRTVQEHKDIANEKFDRAKHFFSEEYFPEERRDQFIFRFKKVGQIAVSWPNVLTSFSGHHGVAKARRLPGIHQLVTRLH